MKNKILFSVLLLIPFLVTAQSQKWKRMRYEWVAAIGASNFLGELGGANQIGTNYFRDLNISMTRPALSLGMRYKLSDYSAIKSAFYYARLRGDDKLTEEPFRRSRNLNFRSPVIEFNTQFELSFRRESVGSRYKVRRIKGRGKKANDLYAYGFAGLGIFWFNPHEKLNGTWYALHPLHTEGEGLVPTRRNYHRLQVCIPVGIAAKYAVNPLLSIGVEFGLRKTFTDYIDDVSTTYFSQRALKQNFGPAAAALADPSLYKSGANNHNGIIYGDGPFGGCQTCPNQQRGDPTDNDSYMFLTIMVSKKIKTTRKGLPKF